MGAWNAYRGLYCVQPAPRQKNRSHDWQSLQPSHLSGDLATNEIVTKNEYEKNFHAQTFSLNPYFRMDHVTRNALAARNNEA